MMIRPITPWILTSSENLQTDWWIILLLIIVSGFAAMFLGFASSKKFFDDKRKTGLLFTGIAVSMSIILICFFGCAMSTIKGIVLSLILLVSSYSDIKRREVEDYLSLMVVLTAFIGIEISQIPFAILSAIIVSIPTILVCILCEGKTIGGADIKLTAACAMVIGVWGGLIGLMIGLTLSIIVNLVIQNKDKEETFPLIPYLATGFMVAYFI
ncbi:MAG: prepilin peptidase [Eubacteriales bacterium]|nr:prepilin peptidase [Eubacteriales bacterium]MDD4474363.1 prepilin peptidase [Eubacteriales bacterium]